MSASRAPALDARFRAWLVPVLRDGRWSLEIPEYGRRWYSEEQYDSSFVRMHQIIMERFRVRPLPADQGLRAAIEAIGYSLVKRMQIIEDGTRRWIAMCRPRSISAATLNDLGTVNTDRRIAFAIREAAGFPLDDRSKAIILDQYVFDITGKGDYITAGMIFNAFLTETASSSPCDPPLARWGLGPNDRTFTREEIGSRKILPDNTISPPGDYTRITNPGSIVDSEERRMRETIVKAQVETKLEQAKAEEAKRKRPSVRRSMRPEGSDAPGQGSIW